MKKLEFLVQDDHDTIVPNYPCGFKDKTVQVSYHGANWATWKLTDMAQKHAESCANCKFHLNDITGIFAAMAESMKGLGEAAKKAGDQMADYLVAHILGGTPIDEELKEEVLV